MAKITKGRSSSVRKKNRRKVSDGVVHVHTTFNNTIITITDKQGNVLTQSSAGACGNKGARKGTALAAEVAAKRAGADAQELYGLSTVEIRLKGPGSGRDSAIRGLHSLRLNITYLIEATPIPHNGCRPRKRRRV